MRVAHLTTVDMSLRFLVLPQLRSVVELDGEAYGISAPGPFVDEIVAAGVRFVPLEGSTRGWSLGDDLRAARALWGILRQDSARRPPHPQPQAGRLRADRGSAGRGTPRGQHRPRPVRHRGRPSDQAARGVPAGGHRLALLRRRVGAEPRGSRPCSPDGDISAPKKTGLLGNGVDLERFNPERFDRRGAGADQGRGRRRPRPTSSSVWWGGWWPRRDIPSCSRPPRGWATATWCSPSAPTSRTSPTRSPVRWWPTAESAGVRFLGMRDDVDRLYAAMDIFVLPSHREGFPRSAMEAAAMGLPVVATDIRGCRQVVADGVDRLRSFPSRTPMPCERQSPPSAKAPKRAARWG